MLPPGVMEAHHAKLEFFKASISEHMLERLVGKYMLLSEEELENWNTDTEDFCEFVCVFVRERESVRRVSSSWRMIMKIVDER